MHHYRESISRKEKYNRKKKFFFLARFSFFCGILLHSPLNLYFLNTLPYLCFFSMFYKHLFHFAIIFARLVHYYNYCQSRSLIRVARRKSVKENSTNSIVFLLMKHLLNHQIATIRSNHRRNRSIDRVYLHTSVECLSCGRWTASGHLIIANSRMQLSASSTMSFPLAAALFFRPV